MAKPSLRVNKKLTRLVRMIGRINPALAPYARPLAVGLLELLWGVAYEAASPEVGSRDEVEAAAEWNGPRGRLAESLIRAGFVEKGAQGRLTIHDYWDHAPQYVKRRAERMEAANTSGERPSGKGHRRSRLVSGASLARRRLASDLQMTSIPSPPPPEESDPEENRNSDADVRGRPDPPHPPDPESRSRAPDGEPDRTGDPETDNRILAEVQAAHEAQTEQERADRRENLREGLASLRAARRKGRP